MPVTIAVRPTGLAARAARLGRRPRVIAAVAVAAVAAALLTPHGGHSANVEALDVAGNVQPASLTNLDFGIAGRVATVNVTAGQTVAAGTVLATLDTTAVSAQLTQAQDALDQANAKLALDSGGAGSVSPGQQASAQNAVDTARAQLDAARTALSDTQRSGQAGVAGAQLNVGAGAAVIAAAQGYLDDAEQGLRQVIAAAANASKAADEVINAVEDAAQAAVQVAQEQVEAAQRDLDDQRNLSAKAVKTAQVNAAAADQVVALDQHNLTADQNILAADQAQETADCTANPASAACLADEQAVANDQARIANDEQLLTRDRAVSKPAEASAAQTAAAAKANNDQAASNLEIAQANLESTRKAGDSAVASAELTKAQLEQTNSNYADTALTAVGQARVALAQSQQATGAAQTQNALSQAQAKAALNNDAAQSQVTQGLVGVQNAQRSLAALAGAGPAQQLRADRDQVDSAQAGLAVAQHQLGLATLVAPVSATVGQVNITVGEKVDAPTPGGGHAIVLETPGKFQMTVQVTDANITKVKLDDAVEVVVASSPTNMSGTVTAIAPTATINKDGSASYAVTGTFDPAGVDVRPGMSGKMRIILGPAPPGATPNPLPPGHPSPSASPAGDRPPTIGGG